MQNNSDMLVVIPFTSMYVCVVIGFIYMFCYFKVDSLSLFFLNISIFKSNLMANRVQVKFILYFASVFMRNIFDDHDETSIWHFLCFET